MTAVAFNTQMFVAAPRAHYGSAVISERDQAVEAAFAANSEDALRQVYDRFSGLVYTICCRSLPASQAEEVTQQVFISAWKNQKKFDPSKGSLAAWLSGIAKFRIIDMLRSESRAARNSEMDDPASKQARAEADELVEHLVISDAIAQLPERPARVLTMALYEEMTHTEIAEQLDLPLGTVKSDIRRGLSSLRRALEGVS